MIDLDRLKKLAEAAFSRNDWFDGGLYRPIVHISDLAFIAAMSPDVCLELIAEIRRLERNQPLGPTALCPVCGTSIGGK